MEKKEIDLDILDTISDLIQIKFYTTNVLMILDLLPKEVWSNSQIKILDPVCKVEFFSENVRKD